MYTKLMSFIKKNNILYRHQYGFRPKLCTIHPIMHLLHHCANATSTADPEFTLAVLCDLSKAFDVINHEILSGSDLDQLYADASTQIMVLFK